MSEQKEKIGFTVACVSEFAQQHNISLQESFRYLFQFKGIAFIKENYELDSLDEEELFDEYMTLSDELAMELEEYMPEDIIINARAYKWDNSDNTIKLVLAMAHLELGELKLSDITRRLLTQVD